MRRLAMGAVLGAIAFASPVDSLSSGAATHNVRPDARAATRAAPDRAEELAQRAAEHATPSAEDDMKAIEDARLTSERVAASRRRAERNARRPPSDEAVWRALGECESHNNPTAVSASGKYRGAFQFSVPTWRGLGYSGDPIEHSYATQLQAAKRLQARSGWGQWPSCARRLGLL
jgi:hypothetical protein